MQKIKLQLCISEQKNSKLQSTEKPLLQINTFLINVDARSK